MTRAKDYLKQIEKLDAMIRNKWMEIEIWKGVAAGSTAQAEGERVQATGSKQKMEKAVVEYVDLENEIKCEIKELARKKHEIIHTIEPLPTAEYNVLFQIYVCYQEFWQVAEKYKKSYSWATSAHGRALAKVQKILDEREAHETSQETENEGSEVHPKRKADAENQG